MNNRTELISLLVSAEEKKFLMSLADEVHLSLTDLILLSTLSTDISKDNWRVSCHQRKRSIVVTIEEKKNR